LIDVGGFSREVYWHAQRSIGFGEKWIMKGFLDGDVKLSSDDVFVCPIGNSAVRRKLVQHILQQGVSGMRSPLLKKFLI